MHSLALTLQLAVPMLSTRFLSVVIPALNEEARLPPTLERVASYLQRNRADAYEVIVVDDGSGDRTAQAVVRIGLSPALRLLRSETNCGKGAALAAGAMAASGELVLLMDADGATQIDELPYLEQQLPIHSPHIAVGSRVAVLSKRPWRRRLMGRVFALTASSCVRGVEDTQCGFKLLSREAALATLPNLHVDGWAYDVELLFIAQELGIGITSVRVAWRDMPGSKITWSTPLVMLRDVLCVRCLYALGYWQVGQGHGHRYDQSSYKEVTSDIGVSI
uniref:dolichyl-phosphate beta-glucosyltransferase n=1 Tax=Coccolithus braarudii TaxID=221442 RepID=A0A7S0L6M2_9EUKA|mmetsp:Transcript_20440/g.43844  ORF Transcript_20440/g.43844 Transcript_20440/m.43844 type:complete len:277 (+) Transcript_20440:9-839(+)